MDITSRTTPLPDLWKGVAAAALISPIVNSLVFLIAYGVGVFPALTRDPAAGAQMSIEPVFLISVVAPAVGIGIFGLFRQRGKARRFFPLAILILLVSFALPFAIPGTTAIQASVLNLMHVTTAAVVVTIAVRLARRRL
jgi:NADH:ubiquinone oxidoreductase subunit K